MGQSSSRCNPRIVRDISRSHRMIEIDTPCPDKLRAILEARWSDPKHALRGESLILTFQTTLALEKLMRAEIRCSDHELYNTFVMHSRQVIATLGSVGWREGHVTMLAPNGGIFFSAKMTMLGITLERHFQTIPDNLGICVAMDFEGPFEQHTFKLNAYFYDDNLGYKIAPHGELGQHGMLGACLPNAPEESLQRALLATCSSRGNAIADGTCEWTSFPREVRDSILAEVLSSTRYTVDLRCTAPIHLRGKMTANVRVSDSPCGLLAASRVLRRELIEAEEWHRARSCPVFLVDDGTFLVHGPAASAVAIFPEVREVRVGIFANVRVLNQRLVVDKVLPVVAQVLKMAPHVRTIGVKFFLIDWCPRTDLGMQRDWQSILNVSQAISIEFLTFNAANIPMGDVVRRYAMICGTTESFNHRLLDLDDHWGLLDLIAGGELHPEVVRCLNKSALSNGRSGPFPRPTWSVNEGNLVSKILPWQSTMTTEAGKLGSYERWSSRST